MSLRARPLLTFFAAALAVACALAWTAPAEAKKGEGRGVDDHDEVWRGRASGAILPLEAILDALPPGARDRVVEVEFEYEDGAPIYEIEYIDATGRLIEVEIDAATGALLKYERD